MTSPRRGGRGGRPRLTIALLVVTSVVVLTLDFRDVEVVRDARHAVGSALSPLQGAADTVGRPFSTAWNGVTNYGDLEDENERLAQRVEELEGRVAKEPDAVAQLDELLAQVDIDFVGDIPTSEARVVRQPGSAFSHVVVIDKGTSDGIRVDQPVVTGAGLVGRVVDADGGRASVQLVSDPDFRVGVRLLTSRRVGVAEGRGTGQPLVVSTGIEPDEDDAAVPPLELVFTSGSEDGRSPFPSGIPVGQVSSTREANGGLNLDVLVEPLAQVNDLQFVSVLLRTPAS